jgi:hypothetical protein
VSRLASLSPAALQAMFGQSSGESLIVLLTITGAGIVTPIRLADIYLQRLSETADEVIYGVMSRGQSYNFLPFNLSLPTEEQQAAPRCTITLHDVTRQLIPAIRQLTGTPTVLIELVLTSSPDTVEASFPQFLLGGISYDANTISGELTVDSLAVEPFPAHSFTPAYFPGLF